jgi:AcrR family transcriptional regulator
MGRRTKDQRRDDYLDIGAAMVAESALAGGADPRLALAHVKLADVAARAGVTKGALYHLWPSQEAFWRDLLHHLIDTNRLLGADKLATVGQELLRPEDPSLRGYANALFDSMKDDPAFFARVSLFSYLDDELVRSSLDEDFRSSIERVLPVLAASITRMGRRPRSASAVRQLAVSVGALLEGICLRHRVDPASTAELPSEAGERLTLFAAAGEALLLAYTEPDHEAGHEITGAGEVALRTGAV